MARRFKAYLQAKREKKAGKARHQPKFRKQSTPKTPRSRARQQAASTSSITLGLVISIRQQTIIESPNLLHLDESSCSNLSHEIGDIIERRFAELWARQFSCSRPPQEDSREEESTLNGSESPNDERLNDLFRDMDENTVVCSGPDHIHTGDNDTQDADISTKDADMVRRIMRELRHPRIEIGDKLVQEGYISLTDTARWRTCGLTDAEERARLTWRPFRTGDDYRVATTPYSGSPSPPYIRPLTPEWTPRSSGNWAEEQKAMHEEEEEEEEEEWMLYSPGDWAEEQKAMRGEEEEEWMPYFPGDRAEEQEVMWDEIKEEWIPNSQDDWEEEQEAMRGEEEMDEEEKRGGR